MHLLFKTQFGQKESFRRPVGAFNEDKKKTKLSNTEILSNKIFDLRNSVFLFSYFILKFPILRKLATTYLT